MTLSRRQFAAASLALSAPVWAQARPIRIIVPYAPGGPIDVTARLLAERVADSLGTVIIENRPGGGGNIAPAHIGKTHGLAGRGLCRLSLAQQRERRGQRNSGQGEGSEKQGSLWHTGLQKIIRLFTLTCARTRKTGGKAQEISWYTDCAPKVPHALKFAAAVPWPAAQYNAPAPFQDTE